MGGYTIDVYLRESSDGYDCNIVVDEIIHNIIPGSTLSEQHGRFLRFDVPDVSSFLGLGETFFRLEQLKQDQNKWHVENYAIKQCSLEQVFVKLVDVDHSPAINAENNEYKHKPTEETVYFERMEL